MIREKRTGSYDDTKDVFYRDFWRVKRLRTSPKRRVYVIDMRGIRDYEEPAHAIRYPWIRPYRGPLFRRFGSPEKLLDVCQGIIYDFNNDTRKLTNRIIADIFGIDRLTYFTWRSGYYDDEAIPFYEINYSDVLDQFMQTIRGKY